MESFVSRQIMVFLYTLYGGALIGLIYDLYKVFRILRKPGKIATGIMDTLFWVVAALICFNILYKSNYGELRGYAFVGFILGSILYARLCSKHVVNILSKILNKLRNVLFFIYKGLIFPFELVSKTTKSFAGNLLNKIPILNKLNQLRKYTKILFTGKNTNKKGG